MRRILLLITDLQIGGTPTVVRELALRLAAGGDAQVEVACLAPWGPVAEEISAGGVAVTPLDARGAASLPLIVWRLARLVRSHKIDVVFSLLVHANLTAALASWLCPGVRWLQSIQTTQPYPAWHWRVQALAGRRAEKIVVPSESVAAAARDWARTPAGKIVVIPNAVALEHFSGWCCGERGLQASRPNDPECLARDSVVKNALDPERPMPASSGGESGSCEYRRIGVANTDARDEFGPSNQPEGDPIEKVSDPIFKDTARMKGPAPRIGFIGRLDPIKRIGDLIDAMQWLDPAVELHIYGEGAERATLQATIDRVGLAPRVRLHGAIARADAALAAIDLLALPSMAEGFGLVLIEAMAAGVPVVATDVPGIRDVVLHDQTGVLVPVASPKALAGAIAALLSDPQRRATLAAAALTDVRRRFSWETVLPMYRDLLGISSG